jgi:Fe-S cluster assembly iron-binding protein IscA
MLQVTNRAAMLLKTARSEQSVPEEYGVRVQAPDESRGGAVSLKFTPAPVEGDQVQEADGVRVFVAPEVAEPLADQVMDLRETPTGSVLFLRGQGDE